MCQCPLSLSLFRVSVEVCWQVCVVLASRRVDLIGDISSRSPAAAAPSRYTSFDFSFSRSPSFLSPPLFPTHSPAFHFAPHLTASAAAPIPEQQAVAVAAAVVAVARKRGRERYIDLLSHVSQDSEVLSAGSLVLLHPLVCPLACTRGPWTASSSYLASPSLQQRMQRVI